MPLKVGLIGMGHIGDFHAKSYFGNDLAELVAVCDIDRERAEAAASKYGARAYTGVAEMLKTESLDFVDICTAGPENGGFHFEPAMLALAAGKHVLVEKPLSNNIQECREMVRFAAEQKLYLGCNLNHYFTKAADIACGYIEDGQIGETVYVLFKVGFDGGEYTYTPGPNLPYGHMKAFLTHPFSVMRHFCGDITEVQAFARTPSFRAAHGDRMLSVNSIHVRFASGAAGYLISQRGDAVYGLGGWWSFELAGSKGTLCIENCVEKVTFWGAPTPESKPAPVVTATGVTNFETTFDDRIRAFLEDLSSGVPLAELRGSGRDALATMEYVFAVIDSYEKGGALVRPHPLPELK